jgi:hypothetical protein
MTSSDAKMSVAHARHVASAKASEVSCAKASDVTAAKAAHVTSTEAAATAEAAPTVSSTTSASAASGLRTRGQKAAGKHCACQNHHHSSSHDILHLRWRIFRHKVRSDAGVFAK